MENLTLLTCSYNTPVVTDNMLKTFCSLHAKSKILVSENSTNEETVSILESAGIPFLRNVGGLHGPSVDILIEKCTTDYALLVDTDVIFLREHINIFNQFKSQNIALMGEIVGDRGGKKLHTRVNPWHCFIDIKAVKENNIKFFDIERRLSQGERVYDVGSSFFEDVKNSKLRIADFKGNNYYYKHYEGMSWRVNKYGKSDGDIDTDNTATHTNVRLFEYGKQLLEAYLQETQYINTLSLSYNA